MAVFLPSIVIAKGVTLDDATKIAMYYQLVAPAAIIGLTWLIRRGVLVRLIGMTGALLNAIGALGLLMTSHWLTLWAVLLGLGSVAIFTLTLMLFSLRTYHSDVARDVSGMVQVVGYGLAFFGPVLMGALYEHYQSWHPPVLLLFVLMAVNVLVAWFATADYMFGSDALGKDGASA